MNLSELAQSGADCVRLRAQDAVATSRASPVLRFLEEELARRVREPNERWDEAMAALGESLREGTPWCWQPMRN